MDISIIGNQDKRKFMDTFISAYGRVLKDNPYLIPLSQYLPKDYFTEDERRNNDFYARMVFLPGGEYEIEKNNSFSGPQDAQLQKVYVNEFFVDKGDVAVGEYLKCVEADECSAPNEEFFCWLENNNKVGCVAWNQASEKGIRERPIITAISHHINQDQVADFCKWIGKRLPTAIEWGYAGRSAGKDLPYPWKNISRCVVSLESSSLPI